VVRHLQILLWKLKKQQQQKKKPTKNRGKISHKNSRKIARAAQNKQKYVK
jgi:hypothetical protein